MITRSAAGCEGQSRCEPVPIAMVSARPVLEVQEPKLAGEMPPLDASQLAGRRLASKDRQLSVESTLVDGPRFAAGNMGGEPPSRSWMRTSLARTYRKGETIVSLGSEINEWMAISRGVACIQTMLAAEAKVAVAALWFGDVVGRGSPLGKRVAMYEVTALSEVETISMAHAGGLEQVSLDKMRLYTATASRLNRQIAMKLAGNGPQRLMSVLATLGQAFAQGPARMHRPHALALPISQSCLGQLAGLSRRQVWIYASALAEAVWVQTSRTSVILQDLSSWLLLLSEVERQGLHCISTVEQSVDTLAGLVFAAKTA